MGTAKVKREKKKFTGAKIKRVPIKAPILGVPTPQLTEFVREWKRLEDLNRVLPLRQYAERSWDKLFSDKPYPVKNSLYHVKIFLGYQYMQEDYLASGKSFTNRIRRHIRASSYLLKNPKRAFELFKDPGEKRSIFEYESSNNTKLTEERNPLTKRRPSMASKKKSKKSATTPKAKKEKKERKPTILSEMTRLLCEKKWTDDQIKSKIKAKLGIKSLKSYENWIPGCRNKINAGVLAKGIAKLPINQIGGKKTNGEKKSKKSIPDKKKGSAKVKRKK